MRVRVSEKVHAVVYYVKKVCVLECACICLVEREFICVAEREWERECASQ